MNVDATRWLTAKVGIAGVLVNLLALAILSLGAALTVSTAMADDAATKGGMKSASGPIRLVAFGDSLTAGYMLPPKESFPAQLGEAMKAAGLNAVVENAGVSGDTTAAGLERLEWSVPPGTEGVILELGANDALRGIDPMLAEKALDEIMTRLKARGIEILLAGMLAPKNWGEDYERNFNGIYARLAERHGALLYPFFLDGIALSKELNLPDGLHPTGKGVAVIVERILPKVRELIAKAEQRRAAGTAPR